MCCVSNLDKKPWCLDDNKVSTFSGELAELDHSNISLLLARSHGVKIRGNQMKIKITLNYLNKQFSSNNYVTDNVILVITGYFKIFRKRWYASKHVYLNFYFLLVTPCFYIITCFTDEDKGTPSMAYNGWRDLACWFGLGENQRS